MFDLLASGIQRLTALAAGGLVVPGDGAPGAGTEPAAVAHQAGEAVQAAEVAGLGSMLPMLLIWVVVLGGFFFFMSRSQKKRERKLKEAQSNIKAGDNVVTNSGMFGRVADVGTDCFVLEVGISGRSVKIPVLKSEVLGVREPVLTPPPKEVTES